MNGWHEHDNTGVIMKLVASGPEGGSLAKAPPDWRFVRDLLATSLFVDIIALGYLCLHLDWQMQNETPLLTVLVTRIIFDFCLLIGWRCRNQTLFSIVMQNPPKLHYTPNTAPVARGNLGSCFLLEHKKK